MATFADAQAGWTIFKEFDFTLSLTELNERLIRRGFSPVAARTYAHYQKLRRYGYEAYLPINQLDVKTLQNLVWDASSRNRYPLLDDRVPVTLRLTRGDEQVEFRGQSIHISEGALAVRIRRKAAVDFFGSRASWKNAALQVMFDETGEIEQATLDTVTIDESSGAVNLRLSFGRLLPLENVLHRDLLASTTFRVVIDSGETSAPLADVVEDLWWLLQALETSRAICQEILLSLDADHRYVLPATRIQKLSLSSPLEVFLDGNIPQILLIYFGFKGLVRLQGDYWSAQLNKEEALAKRAENRSQGIRPRLDAEQLTEAVTRLIHDFLVAARADLAKRGLDMDRLKSMLEKHLQRSLEGLTEEDTEIVIDLTDEDTALASELEEELSGSQKEPAEEEGDT